jgi:outer membrane protein
MRKSLFRSALLLGVSLFVPGLSGPALHAADAPRKAPAPLYDPQPLNLPGNKITLLDAVRITLQNSPNIKLREQESLAAKGIWQSESGQFDSSIQASAQYLFTQQSLTLSQTTAEVKNRTDRAKDIAAEQKQVDTYQTQVNELTKLQADPTGYEITVPDPKLTLVQARVDNYNQQIAAETDPAKQAALIAERDAYISLNLATSQSDQAAAQASVDKQTQDLKNLGEVPNTIQQQTLTLNVQALFPYRDGVTLGLVADGGYSSNRYKGKEKQAEYGGLGIEDQYTADVGFSISAHLLRGRGRDATGAFEKAGEIDFQASELSYKHEASVNVLNTVAAYWNLVGAQEILKAARTSAGLQAQCLEVTDALIAADEVPRAERARALASRASGDALVASALRVVDEARVSLAVAMGTAVDSGANAPYAADVFPGAVEKDVLDTLSPAPLTAIAFERRYDRQAAFKVVDSGAVLARKAETDLRPKLDISGQITANGISETSLSQMANGWTAPSIQAGLAFELPVGNNTARGQYAQSQAQLGQRTINARDLDRNIQANIVQTLATLRDAADQVEQAREAVQNYATTIESEQERFKTGETSVLDSILTQDYQTNALVTYSQAQQVYITLLARLRYETGTLVGETANGYVVREDDLIHLPRPTKAQ